MAVGSSYRPTAVSSEDEFQRQLDDAIVAGRQSVVSADVIRDLPKVRSSECNLTASLASVGPVTRSEGVHVVRKIEGLAPQLQCSLFAAETLAPQPRVARPFCASSSRPGAAVLIPR